MVNLDDPIVRVGLEVGTVNPLRLALTHVSFLATGTYLEVQRGVRQAAMLNIAVQGHIQPA